MDPCYEVTYFRCTLQRDVFLVVSQVICAKSVGATSSEWGLSSNICWQLHRESRFTEWLEPDARPRKCLNDEWIEHGQLQQPEIENRLQTFYSPHLQILECFMSTYRPFLPTIVAVDV